MKKNIVTAFLVLTLAVSAACGANNNPQPTNTPEPTPTVTASLPQRNNSTQTPEPTEHVNPFGEFGTSFELTDEEKALYEQYISNYDVNTFKDAEPVSIAKIFIQCGIDGDWQGEYGLFNPESAKMTRDEWKAQHEKDITTLDIATRKDKADVVFPYIDEGTFSDDGNGKGRLVFKDPLDQETTVNFIKNSDGVWMMDFVTFS